MTSVGQDCGRDADRLGRGVDVSASADGDGAELAPPTSPWWLSGTPLEAEHQRLMRRRPVEVPWEQSTAGRLTDAERARLAGTWRRRAAAEYLAVSTFAVLSVDLVAARAPADVLSLCLRAGIDEVRHAELCLRMIEIYGGRRELPPPGMSSLPHDRNRPKLLQALANTMLVSCVSETYATTVLSATREVTTDPVAAEVLTAIYSDEVMHARLGWSYLRFALEEAGQAAIDAAAAMVPVALRGVANVVERERPEGEVTEAVRGHGLMTAAEERVIFSTCVREVLVPGFEALGIPCGSALDDYGDAWAHALDEVARA
ncbi:MAG: ferritin-like domain-containing protein [Kofleriaceae bacterium]